MEEQGILSIETETSLLNPVRIKDNTDDRKQLSTSQQAIVDEVLTDLPANSDADELDTIIVPAREDGFNEEFLKNDRWYAIRISGAMIDKIKYIAAYQVAPISGITYAAEVDRIEKYKDTNKYIVLFKTGSVRKINKVVLGQKKGLAPQAPRYSSYKTIVSAKSLDDLWS